MKTFCLLNIIFVYFVFIAQCAALDKMGINPKTSLFFATDKTVPVISSSYIAWGKDWRWAGITTKPIVAKADSYGSLAYTGEIKRLHIDFNCITKLGAGLINWDYSWHLKRNLANAIGFGLEFVFKLDSPSFDKPAQAAELLPDNKGWRWQAPNGRTVEITFSPPVAKLYFEGSQKDRIRAMFFTKVDKGTKQTTMTAKVSKHVALSNLAALNYDESDPQTWRRDILSDKVSPIDLSFLNKNDIPAGKHGFVKAKADQLTFEDGTPAKFWGANLMAQALFTTSEMDIKTHAKRIAQLGFNLIRIHHHDSKWVKPNIFKNQDDNTQELSPEAFKKLDLWIKHLKEHGVYVWLDLHVGREVTKKDGIDNFEDIAKGKSQASIRGFNYYNKSIQQQMQKFNEAYLSHINPFTELAYKNDPAVIALLLTNENDLTTHFGNKLLPEKGSPLHHAIFLADAKAFAKATGLPTNQVWRTWEMGPSKIYLSDVEHRFNQRMISHLRKLGAKAMIATTNSWGKMGLYGLPSLTDGDLIDAHTYGRAEELSYNPRYNPGFLTWIAGAQVLGKPLSATEWNMEPFPVPDRFISPIYVASIASFQSWDAMMLYGYSQKKLGALNNGSNYSTFNDPAITGMMPAAALLFRQNHVSPAKQNYHLKLDKDNFFYKKQDPTTSKTIRTLMETSHIDINVPSIPELQWLPENNAKNEKDNLISDVNVDYIPSGQDFVVSDTGELKRDWNKGIHTVNTAQSQIVSGWIGGEEIKLNDVNFKVATKKALVAVQSLGDEPIAKAHNIFITVMARSQPVNGAKFASESVEGVIKIKAPKGLHLYSINSLGAKSAAVETKFENGSYIIDLAKNKNTHWYKLDEK